MSRAIVSSMVLFLVLLLVFPRMDSARTTQMEVNKLSGAGGEETTHPDQVTAQLQGRFPKICGQKCQDFIRRHTKPRPSRYPTLPKSPPPPPRHHRP